MEVIRERVFETNSSSTHSISIAGALTNKDTLAKDPEGVVHIYRGEFGWEEESFQDAESKASYAYEYARGNLRLMEQLERVIKANVPGCIKVCFGGGEGYIDHQSNAVCSPAFESDEALARFIFSPDSVLRTDNDNH